MLIGKITEAALLAVASAGLSAGTLAAPLGADIRVGPPPRVEVAPSPRRGNVWVSGYWNRGDSDHLPGPCRLAVDLA